MCSLRWRPNTQLSPQVWLPEQWQSHSPIFYHPTKTTHTDGVGGWKAYGFKYGGWLAITITHNISHMALTYSTDTQVNSQSQIRWQIRRLMLLGGCGVGAHPPLLQAVPQNSHKTSDVHHNGVKAAKPTYKWHSLVSAKNHLPIEVPAFSFTPSLFFLALPLSQHLSSFPQQPPSQSSQRWHHHVAASAEAALWICVSVCVCVCGRR